MMRGNSELSVLTNSGIATLNADCARARQRTLIVLGVARSGTTMVAGAMHHLGIDVGMGAKPNAVYEDAALADALEQKNHVALSKLIAERDARNDVWGWKRPSALLYIAKVERYFRNPEYVVVFRDIFAIANRNRISVHADLLQNMADSIAQYRQLLKFLDRCRRRTLLVSYEKALLDSNAFVDALAEFVGGCDASRRSAAVAFVRENSDAYLASSRNWHGEGELSSVEVDRVMGWAYIPGDPSPATVRLMINGRMFGALVADLPRPPLKELGVHPTGKCGFNFRLPKNRLLRPGDVVSVRVVGETRDLRNSPRKFVPPPVVSA